MREGILTGHQVVATHTITKDDIRTVRFECANCDFLRGDITASPPELADATVADLMATHWAATGGERS